MARRTDYKPEYCIQAEKLCKLGAKDKELADFFNTSEQTLNSWKQKFPEFLESLKKGKILADANVASSLYHRAIGYNHEDVDIKVIRGKIVMTRLTKHYPPDTIAAIFWLKNRQKDNWRDKTESDVNLSGKIKVTLSNE